MEEVYKPSKPHEDHEEEAHDGGSSSAPMIALSDSYMSEDEDSQRVPADAASVRRGGDGEGEGHSSTAPASSSSSHPPQMLPMTAKAKSLSSTPPWRDPRLTPVINPVISKPPTKARPPPRSAAPY
jgi:hypothetical protein